jgi:hypothetical protein
MDSQKIPPWAKVEAPAGGAAIYGQYPIHKPLNRWNPVARFDEEPPTEPPPDPEVPPVIPPEGGWAWVPPYGWVWVPEGTHPNPSSKSGGKK